MKKKRTISMKDPQLRKVRNNLREIIYLAVGDEYSGLIGERSSLDLERNKERIKFLSDRLDKLDNARKSSICICPTCKSRTSDMTFNPYLKAWFCVECYEKNRQFYIKRGEPHIYP